MKINWNRLFASLGETGPYVGAPGLPSYVRASLLRRNTADQSEDLSDEQD